MPLPLHSYINYKTIYMHNIVVIRNNRIVAKICKVIGITEMLALLTWLQNSCRKSLNYF